MIDLLGQLHRAGQVYQGFISAAGQVTGPIDRQGLFAYRTGVMQSEVVKPLVLFLYDPDEAAISDDQLIKALDVVESWLVRRMQVRATSKSYTQVFAELIEQVRKSGRQRAGDVIEDHLQHQPGTNYGPTVQDRPAVVVCSADVPGLSRRVGIRLCLGDSFVSAGAWPR